VLRRDHVVRGVADHDCFLRRHLSRTEKRDLDEGRIRLVVLNIVAVSHGIDEIAHVQQRKVVIELVGGRARGQER
jgi:hypothetical protein